MNRTLRWVAIFYYLACCGNVQAQLGGQPPATQSPRAQQLPASGRPQFGSVAPVQGANSAGSNSVDTSNSSIQIQGAYQGSVSHGHVTAEPLSLSLQDAIKRAVKYNLGAIDANEASRQARAIRLAAVAQLLPDLTGNIRENVQQINLAAQGLRIQLPLPGFTFPTVVGPFNNYDARAYFRENLSVTSWQTFRSSQANARSAEFFVQDSRELVTLAVAGSYFQLIATAARLETVRAQIESAQAIYQQSVDRNKSGLAARIDVSRTLVELQTQQQRLTSLANDYEKQKLSLARLIGLPMGQTFMLADHIPFHEVPIPDASDLIQRSWTHRADVQAAAAQVKAADLAKRASTAEYYPSLEVAADYGATGITPTNESHGTFSASAGVQFPIFRFGRIQADIQQADAVLNQRKAEEQDAKDRAEQDVRVALLDLNTAYQQIKVAESNRSLAADTLQQSRDRFRAGVADTVELVQAEESVAAAEQDYISALYSLNLAQVSLARAIGDTDQGIMRMLQGK